MRRDRRTRRRPGDRGRTAGYTAAEVLAWLKALPLRDSACPKGGRHAWTVRVIEDDRPVLGWTSKEGFFTGACARCGYAGLYNARELIGKYGEWEST